MIVQVFSKIGSWVIELVELYILEKYECMKEISMFKILDLFCD